MRSCRSLAESNRRAIDRRRRDRRRCSGSPRQAFRAARYRSRRRRRGRRSECRGSRDRADVGLLDVRGTTRYGQSRTRHRSATCIAISVVASARPEATPAIVQTTATVPSPRLRSFGSSASRRRTGDVRARAAYRQTSRFPRFWSFIPSIGVDPRMTIAKCAIPPEDVRENLAE